MINYNERFSLKPQRFCWELHDATYNKVTYHNDLLAITKEVIDREAGQCESMEEIRELLLKFDKILTAKV